MVENTYVFPSNSFYQKQQLDPRQYRGQQIPLNS